METALTPQRMVAELSKSTHGDLKAYVPITQRAARENPEFLAHLIAWNQLKGQVRDSKLAIPLASLVRDFPFAENSFAHLALLSPRDLVRAMHFCRDAGVSPWALRKRVVEPYVRAREANPGWLIRTVLLHRESLKELYSVNKLRPHTFADSIVFKGACPPGPLAAKANLKNMTPAEAASAIVKYRIPYLAASAALKGRMKDPDVVLALIDTMTPTELVTNTKMLERLGVKTNPALRAAYEAGLARVAKNTSKTVLKTARAAENVGDAQLKAKLVAVQEKQIKAAGIEGDWLVLGDKSGSMHSAIEVARQVAGVLTTYVKGTVNLVWFDNMPRAMNVTGKTYDQIKAETKHVLANGGTSIGCGLQWAMDKGLNVQGIAIVSDGGENAPPYFPETYARLCAKSDSPVPVYFYRVPGEPDVLSKRMKSLGQDVQIFDIGRDADFYSLPNIVQTMRASRYSLHDEIMDTPLLTLGQVFKSNEGEEDEAAA